MAETPILTKTILNLIVDSNGTLDDYTNLLHSMSNEEKKIILNDSTILTEAINRKLDVEILKLFITDTNINFDILCQSLKNGYHTYDFLNLIVKPDIINQKFDIYNPLTYALISGVREPEVLELFISDQNLMSEPSVIDILTDLKITDQSIWDFFGRYYQQSVIFTQNGTLVCRSLRKSW